MATPTLTIPEDEFRAWHQAVEARIEMRGAPAIAKELEASLKRASGGQVHVSRHQLFSWAESLEGIASRDPRRASAGAHLSLAQVVGDIRRVLSGGPSTGAAPPSPPADAPARHAAPAPLPVDEPDEAPAERMGAAGPPPVMYVKGGAAAPAGSIGFLAPGATGDAARRLLREARTEVLVISPWSFGLDTLAEDILALPESVAVRLVTRRPDKDDPAYHKHMERMTRRGAEVRFSPFLQTRMLIVDGQKLMLGAASVPPSGAPTREAALVVSDRVTAQQAREHFARQFEEGMR